MSSSRSGLPHAPRANSRIRTHVRYVRELDECDGMNAAHRYSAGRSKGGGGEWAAIEQMAADRKWIMRVMRIWADVI